jgi:hypothetical protein
MKTSVPKIKNVRPKNGGAQLYILPKVEIVKTTDDPEVIGALEGAVEFAKEHKVISVVVCMVCEDDVAIVLDGGLFGASTFGALEIAKSSIMKGMLNVQ